MGGGGDKRSKVSPILTPVESPMGEEGRVVNRKEGTKCACVGIDRDSQIQRG